MKSRLIPAGVLFAGLAAFLAPAATAVYGADIPVNDWNGLHGMRNDLSGNYVLTNDLDRTTAGYDDVAGPAAGDGAGWEPVGDADNRFTGRFDGGGFTISNLRINRPDTEYVGLFGFTDGAVLRNFNVRDAQVAGDRYTGIAAGRPRRNVEIKNISVEGNVEGGSWTGGVFGHVERTDVSGISFRGNVESRGRRMYSGGLAGQLFGPLTAENIRIRANISGGRRTGGITGYARSRAVVREARVEANILGITHTAGLVGLHNLSSRIENSYFSGRISSAGGSGGIAGEVKNSTITDSYSAGRIEGSGSIGGAVGVYDTDTADRNLENCYSAMSVIGGEDAGGFVAEVIRGDEHSGIINCFWDVQAGGEESAGGTGMAPEQLKSLSTFREAGWDIAEIEEHAGEAWKIDDGNDFPRLGWEEED